MAEETTPLLLDSSSISDHENRPHSSHPSFQAKLAAEAEHNAIYSRFSNARKRVIVALIAFCGLLPLFATGSFFPSIPSIARDMNSAPSIISLTVSVSVLAACIGALFGASYSTFYGRKPVYLVGLPLLIIGSLGVAFSQTITELMLWRFVQTFGGSPGLSVGAGVIGDIYRLEERGTAMGIFFGACLLGPALAPLVGGIITQYASWRIMQLFLGAGGLIAFILIAFFCPETSIPGSRGIDKKRAELVTRDEAPGEHWFKIIWINPLQTLYMLRSPNLLAVALAGSTVLLTDYVILTPLASTVGAQYGISNQAALGACYIPIGLGNFIGAPAAGYLSDQIVKRRRIQRNGVWYPEDRLIGTLWASATLVPLSTLGLGLITTYVESMWGLWVAFVCLFANGIGVDLVLSPSTAYVVDIMHSRSAESMAANNGFRSLLISAALAIFMTLLDKIGLVWTNGIVAILAWFGFGLLWLTVRYGEQMRAWVDIGYTTIENA